MKMFLVNIRKFGEKNSNVIKIEFNIELVYNKKHLKAKNTTQK